MLSDSMMQASLHSTPSVLQEKQNLLEVLERMPSIKLVRAVNNQPNELDLQQQSSELSETQLDKRIDAILNELNDRDPEPEPDPDPDQDVKEKSTSNDDSDSDTSSDSSSSSDSDSSSDTESSRSEKKRRVKREKRGLSVGESISLSIRRFGHSLKRFFNEVLSYLAIFSLINRHVERRLGPAATAYFKLLAFAFWINAFVQVVLAALITIPYLANYSFSSEVVAEAFKLSQVPLLFPPPPSHVLFYSGYKPLNLTLGSDAATNATEVSRGTYDLEAAYTYVMLAAFGLYFIAVGVRLMRRSTRGSSPGSSSAAQREKAFQSVFLPAMQLDLHGGRSEPLMAFLLASRSPDRVLNWAMRCRLAAFRLLAWCVTLILIAAVVYAEYVLLLWNMNLELNSVERQVLVPLAITAMNILVPLLMPLVVLIERYNSPAARHAVTLLRLSLLRFATVAIITVFYVFDEISQDAGSKLTSAMWEYYFASFVYQLLVYHILALLLVTLVVEGGWKLFLVALDKCKSEVQVEPSTTSLEVQVTSDTAGLQTQDSSKRHKWAQPLRFAVVKDALDIVYLQMLIWLALFYSPLLPGFVSVLMLVLMLVKAIIVINCCRRGALLTTNDRNEVVLVYTLCFAILFTFFCVCLFLFNKRPSEGSLLSNLNTALEMTEELLESAQDVLLLVTDLLLGLGGMLALLVLIISLVAFGGMQSRGYTDAERILKNKVTLEMLDVALYNRELRDSLAHVPAHTRTPAPDRTVASSFVGRQFTRTPMTCLVPQSAPHTNESQSIVKLRSKFNLSLRTLLPLIVHSERFSIFPSGPKYGDTTFGTRTAATTVAADTSTGGDNVLAVSTQVTSANDSAPTNNGALVNSRPGVYDAVAAVDASSARLSNDLSGGSEIAAELMSTAIAQSSQLGDYIAGSSNDERKVRSEQQPPELRANVISLSNEPTSARTSRRNSAIAMAPVNTNVLNTDTEPVEVYDEDAATEL